MAASSRWSLPPANFKLGEDEAHIWRTGPDLKPATLAKLEKSLSPDEREKAARFHFEKDRRRYVIAHGVLRALVGHYSGEDGHALRFCSNQWGKPFVEGLTTNLDFNLSHSGEIVLHGFTLGRQIGIDHELIRPDFATQEITERFFSPAEASRLRSLPSELQVRAFFNCWTRKEAYIKGRGKGLSIGLDKFEVSFAPGERAALLVDRNDPQAINRWSVHELELGAEYVGALAVEGKDMPLCFWKWEG
jgi:4'-phosphopantetheinyl transferase